MPLPRPGDGGTLGAMAATDRRDEEPPDPPPDPMDDATDRTQVDGWREPPSPSPSLSELSEEETRPAFTAFAQERHPHRRVHDEVTQPPARRTAPPMLQPRVPPPAPLDAQDARPTARHVPIRAVRTRSGSYVRDERAAAPATPPQQPGSGATTPPPSGAVPGMTDEELRALHREYLERRGPPVSYEALVEQLQRRAREILARTGARTVLFTVRTDASGRVVLKAKPRL